MEKESRCKLNDYVHSIFFSTWPTIMTLISPVQQETIAEERQILQFHYTEWHSHTNPFSNAVLEFRRRVRAVVGNIITANSLVGPMLVHCK